MKDGISSVYLILFFPKGAWKGCITWPTILNISLEKMCVGFVFFFPLCACVSPWKLTSWCQNEGVGRRGLTRVLPSCFIAPISGIVTVTLTEKEQTRSTVVWSCSNEIKLFTFEKYNFCHQCQLLYGIHANCNFLKIHQWETDIYIF